MNVSILDCTLRDGGYVNNWEFGHENIKTIISRLSATNIEIIECGFLSNKKVYTVDQTQFNSIQEIEECIANYNSNNTYVCMINLGEYAIEDIPTYTDGKIEGIRVVFHQKQVNDAIEFARAIINKGYKVFIQPMTTINYSDRELIDLIDKVNEIAPYAMYIVDSFGVMKPNDLTRMIHLLDNNLDKEIRLGYHAHNNLQLAYSNAQTILMMNINRQVIIDSSIFGMGRGAGNLNTELFADYLNNMFDKDYKIEPILTIIDDILVTIYEENYWGYSLAHYLSAVFNCHPNYASYLDDKNALTVKAMSDILAEIEPTKKVNFDKEYIEKLYIKYQTRYVDDQKAVDMLKDKLNKRSILVLAPGKSIKTHEQKIKSYKEANNPIVIAINFIPKEIKSDYIFVSNLKRFEMLKDAMGVEEQVNMLITSNIDYRDIQTDYIFQYDSLLNDNNQVKDNATLLFIKLLVKCGIHKVAFAGFDGYNYDKHENYVDQELRIPTKSKNISILNTNIKEELNKIGKLIDMSFVTPNYYGYESE